MLAACSNDLCELFDVILSGAVIDARDSCQWTALSYACWYGHYEMALQLLDSGADPDVHESYSMVDTPLSLAAQEGHFDIVRLLIAHGANPNLYAGVMAARAECHARRKGFHAISEFLLYHEDKHPLT
jgi:ankyrin repeat protein